MIIEGIAVLAVGGLAIKNGYKLIRGSFRDNTETLYYKHSGGMFDMAAELIQKQIQTKGAAVLEKDDGSGRFILREFKYFDRGEIKKLSKKKIMYKQRNKLKLLTLVNSLLLESTTRKKRRENKPFSFYLLGSPYYCYERI